ncbi:MAG: winged helix-turn-helix transcriptional regulator [Nitrososphaerota archaeon]|jgi:DNA-binding MarR family transcriptional regulator|nr:winged helix-turn-helix transcriptional regulator [Nitrososphaerota archaeon]MDG6959846.1 winged helix-turn-helix transcriptional regulator [Nitrososphaerota archaeon]MDG7015074.1 winged helix-turn-helix transcriptional regulator [Nitrososphaerota archaeon]
MESPGLGLLQMFVKQSPVLASGGWGLVVITSLWYQRTTSTWRKMGFDSDVFQLLMRTKGGPTRVRLLRSLTTSKNRLELSRELGYDWNVIDRHIKILLKHGMIEEDTAYGNVKLYQLTGAGKKLMSLIEELQGADAHSVPPTEGKT